MTRKANRRRKHAAPVYVYTYSPIEILLASPTEPMPLTFRTHHLSKMHEGLRAMQRDAQPTTDHWRVCADAINLMETMVLEMQVAADPGGLLNDAIAAMALAGNRHRSHGAIRLDGPGIQAISAVLDDYAALLDVLPERTMKAAHRRTEQRIQAILQNRRQPHDIEVIDL